MTGESPPITLGHEFSGTVDLVGEGVSGLIPGDRVCIQPTIYDGSCRACRKGLTNSCDSFGFIGLSGWGGGMAEFTCAPVEYVKKLPDDMALELGALVEPLAVGWHVGIIPAALRCGLADVLFRLWLRRPTKTAIAFLSLVEGQLGCASCWL